MKRAAYVLAAFWVVLTAADAANYYVNDTNSAGDVYCSALGNDSNSGLSNSAPKATIQRIVDLYDLGGGDTIYVDTGIYYPTNVGKESPGVDLQAWDGGSVGSYMTIQGSTNEAAGGSLFIRGSSVYPAFHSWSSGWIALKNLRITDGQFGFNARMVSNLVFENCFIYNNYGDGALIRECGDVFFRRCRLYHNSGSGLTLWGGVTRIFMDQCTVWSNHYDDSGGPLAEIYYDDGADLLSLSNTIILARGTGHVCMHMDWTSFLPYTADYNNLCAIENAYVGGYGISGAFQTLASWQAASGQDSNSIGGYPELTYDGHLKSRAGTWSNGTWVVYATNSPCIDRGNPAAAYSNEPAPNGGRLNIGAFGNTGQASKTADYDGDGLSDNSECYDYGTNPNLADTDGDQYNDFAELIAGTGPTDGTNFFEVADAPQTNKSRFTMRWYGVSGRTYQPQWRTNLVNGTSWTNCTGLIGSSGTLNTNLIGSNTWITAVDTNANGKTFRYYRVRVSKP